MRKTGQKNAFKRDFRRELKGRHRDVLGAGGELRKVVNCLENDIPLEAAYRDHALHNNWEGSRECHIRPNLLLVYTLEGEDVLIVTQNI